MSYLVIARKWRPQSFAEVTAQEPITRTLCNALEHDRLHHAYLFSGARGVGKTTTARLVAKALNCHKSPRPTPTPCRADDKDACISCREISESRSIDVQEIDAASNTGVDNVREAIIGSVAIAPARDRYKIFIIDEVHMLSTPAFNALLKTIEEPPPRVVFIMATTERHKVPETILSRCQQFEFRTIATAKILDRLRLIAESEQLSVPEDALREIARYGEGSMRDAQSAFDQVISFAGDEIKKEDVEMALGITGAEILNRLVNAIATQNVVEALNVVDEVVMRGHDLRNFCRDILAHLRDLLITKVSGSIELLESAACDPVELKRQATLFSESDLVRFFHSLAETETKLQKSAHPRYQVEIGIVKLIEMQRLEPLGSILDRLKQLEQSFIEGGSSGGTTNSSTSPSSDLESMAEHVTVATTPRSKGATAAVSGMATKTAPIKEASSVAAKGSASETTLSETSDLRDAATTIKPLETAIERLKLGLEARRKMFLVTALEGATCTTIQNGELYIEFDPAARHLRDTLSKAENAKILREICLEVTGDEVEVRILVTDRKSDSAPRSREDEERAIKERLLKVAAESPSVQQLLRTFRGEIVDVQKLTND